MTPDRAAAPPAGGDPLEELGLDRLRTRTSAKWRAYPPDVLPLWVAEMDVSLAPPVRDALLAAVRDGDTGYPHGTGYFQALADFARDRWGWGGVSVDRCAFAADVMVGAIEALRLVTQPGDAVVINPPVYPPFYAFLEHAGLRVAQAPLGPDGRLDLDIIATVFRDIRPAAYLLCSPHNPTGTVHTAAELEALAALAGRFGVRVVADEAHAPLVLPGSRFVPYLSVPGGQDALAVFSAAKGWNLPGLKAAVIVAGTDAAATLARLSEIVSHGPSHLGVLAHTVALTEGRDWLDRLLIGLDRKRALLGQLLAEHLPAVRYRPPEASYLAWLDCRGLGLGEEEPVVPGEVTSTAGAAGFFLAAARVGLSAGPAFGAPGAGHVRLNFATSAQILGEAIRRMAAAVADR
ncbi:MAG: aminotransferase class I/II-fold pyridoxal phosphate-dependent enzyme [Jatrophihabitans sp.]|nr:MAG: aminotransferase class I/II-fold pyridoxal phosphate-dependent enzyme [Jatrophihabitans sp.]